MAGKSVTVSTSVDLTDVEVDVEIDFETMEQAISQMERKEVMALFASVDVGQDITLAAERCFYHYYGQEIPSCLRELIEGATGRVL